MLYLPAAASRTTTHLRWAGKVAAVIAAAIAVTTAVIEFYALLHDTPGAHFSLYAGLIVSSVVAASCLSFAFARTMIGYSATASAADHDAQTSAMRRLADEVGGHAAETADVVTTNEQLVAEVARMRTALRDTEAERRADMERLVGELARSTEQLVQMTEHAAEQAAETRHLRTGLQERDDRLAELVAEYERVLREDLPRAIRRAEARGYVAGFRQRLAERHRPDRGRTRPE
jgi:septal ring factor EnvC (AmiA/AmiB activator)